MSITNQDVGNALGAVGLVALPLLIAFLVYMEKRRERDGDEEGE